MVESVDRRLRDCEKMHKYFWMITQANYGKLRKIKGCEDLGDLNATKTDGGHIQEVA